MSKRVADMIGDIPGAEGFVMPVYGWRVPKWVRGEITAIKARGGSVHPFTWAAFTCGDSIGQADKDLEKLLGRKLDAVFSVVMPDTYLGLPGFRLDSKEEQRKKLEGAEMKCKQIREWLLGPHAVAPEAPVRGPLPFVLTNLVGRIFEKFIVTDRFWKADKTKCVECGRCAAECPTGNITLGDGPVWKRIGNCSLCFRCYHVCKSGAIDLRPFTCGKGRLDLV